MCLLAVQPITAFANEPVDERDAALVPAAIYDYNSTAGINEIADANNHYKDGTRSWQGISTIESVGTSGRLWSAFYSGGPGECKDNFVALVTSSDGGNSWSDVRVIIDPDKTGNVRAFDPVLWRDPNGRLWIFWNQEYTYRAAWSKLDGKFGVFGMYTENPDSDTPIWSTPVRMCNGVMANKPIVTNKGDWLFPSGIPYLWKNGQVPDNEIGPCIYKFEDYGKPCSFFAQPDSNPTWSNIFCEASVVQGSTDDSLICLVRVSNGIVKMTSADYGATWSAPAVMTDGENGTMTVSSSKITVATLPSGNQLMIYHNTLDGTRKALTAAISTDGGITWGHKLLLDSRLNISYPTIALAADGSIYVCYDYGRGMHGGILFAKFTEADVLAGAFVSTGSKTRAVISTNGSTSFTQGWYTADGTAGLSNDFAQIRVTENSGELVALQPGISMFTDVSYAKAQYLPDCFEGSDMIYTKYTAGVGENVKTSFRTMSAGYVYVMTPFEGHVHSQATTLADDGFEKIEAMGWVDGVWSGQYAWIEVWKKQVTANEEFSFGRYAIVLASEYVPVAELTEAVVYDYDGNLIAANNEAVYVSTEVDDANIETLTLQRYNNESLIFEGWFVDGACVSTQTSVKRTLQGKTYTPHFTSKNLISCMSSFEGEEDGADKNVLDSADFPSGSLWGFNANAGYSDATYAGEVWDNAGNSYTQINSGTKKARRSRTLVDVVEMANAHSGTKALQLQPRYGTAVMGVDVAPETDYTLTFYWLAPSGVKFKKCNIMTTVNIGSGGAVNPSGISMPALANMGYRFGLAGSDTVVSTASDGENWQKITLKFNSRNLSKVYLMIVPTASETFWLDDISCYETENTSAPTFVGNSIRTTGEQALRYKFAVPQVNVKSQVNGYTLKEYGGVVIRNDYLGAQQLVKDGVYTVEGVDYTAITGVAYSTEQSINNEFGHTNKQKYFSLALFNIGYNKETKQTDYSKYGAAYAVRPYAIYTNAAGGVMIEYGETVVSNVFGVFDMIENAIPATPTVVKDQAAIANILKTPAIQAAYTNWKNTH